jgi:outer membrane lipoprotein-sorting protein
MLPSHLRHLYFFAAAFLMVGVARAADELPIISKARAYLGSEAALNAIKSVHFTGTVNSTNPADGNKPTTAKIEIIAQKPDQQRVVATTDRGVETTAVDGYEGWQRFQETANPKNQRLTVLKPDAVKRLRAQAWENLSFYRGIERQGGRAEDQGTTKIGDITCQKVAFIHAPNIVFVRYFDVATGRLIRTEADDGGTTQEEGEQVVAGVRFPKTMKMTIKGAKGVTQLVTIALETVKVSETFPDAVFRMPAPGAN